MRGKAMRAPNSYTARRCASMIAVCVLSVLIMSTSAHVSSPPAYSSVTINLPNKDPQQPGLTTDFIVMSAANETGATAALSACEQLLELEQLQKFDMEGYLPQCVRKAEAAVLHSHSVAHALGEKVFRQVDAYRAAVASQLSAAEYALSWAYDTSKLLATLRVLDSHPEWKDVCLLGQYDAIAATAILARRDDVKVLALSQGSMREFVPLLDEYPDRGILAQDYGSDDRRSERLRASEEFLDEQFPGRYFTVDTQHASDIHSFFISLEEKNAPNTCDLIIVDGRMHQESVAHAIDAMEFHHHPDSHALLWYIPDDMMRSTTNIQLVENLQLIGRIAVRAVFGTAASARSENLQGKLVLVDFLNGIERLEGAEYPRSTISQLAEQASGTN